MTAELRNLRYEIRGGAAWITIHRPEKLNALDRATVDEIPVAIDRALHDPDAGAIVVTGAGERAFVAGADIAEMAGLDARDGQEFSLRLLASFERVERSPKPVIAAVNGFALGGGCELAMACHVRIASDAAKFGQPEVLLGLIPGAGGTQRLTRLVGRGKALDLILSGETIDAAEALRIGLVDRLVPAEGLVAAVDAYVAKLRQKSPVALARALQAVISGAETSQAEALRLEAALFGLCFATDDFREGTRAFLEKRKPVFPGR
ncbi:MAG TPA: enoyl-CoA hydratase-related protein [Candidatus Polarisedimenticolaceae bacterium]